MFFNFYHVSKNSPMIQAQSDAEQQTDKIGTLILSSSYCQCKNSRDSRLSFTTMYRNASYSMCYCRISFSNF